ncbi:YqjF family protein [Halpernia sp. GG3]
MSFLTAEWKNLAMINYEIDPKILDKYVPPGTELDLFEGKCFVSFIGFLFENVKILGLKIPFHTDFEEVNLRFYVRRFENGIWKRGAVFISEIVPKFAISFVANTFYNEHYQTVSMKHQLKVNKDSREFIYQWKVNNKWNTIHLETKKDAIDIEFNSETEFITEHYFGYNKLSESKTIEYEVRHPRWQQYEVTKNTSVIDIEGVYGKEFAFIKDLKPSSVLLAIGSEISIEVKRKF